MSNGEGMTKYERILDAIAMALVPVCVEDTAIREAIRQGDRVDRVREAFVKEKLRVLTDLRNTVRDIVQEEE